MAAAGAPYSLMVDGKVYTSHSAAKEAVKIWCAVVWRRSSEDGTLSQEDRSELQRIICHEQQDWWDSDIADKGSMSTSAITCALAEAQLQLQQRLLISCDCVGAMSFGHLGIGAMTATDRTSRLNLEKTRCIYS